MLKRICFLGLLLFFGSSSVALAASQKDDLKHPTLDLIKYIDFIKEWTSYKYDGSQKLPKVEVTKHELVQIFAFGDFEYAQAESKNIQLPTVLSVYDADRKTIYISDQLDLTDPSSEVTLVHELVHYMQDINGYTKSLNGHIECTESEAYDVQMVWQKINNVDVDQIKFVYQRSVLAAIRCMGSKKSSFSNGSQIDIK
jgi:hypothetical protein